MEQKETALPKYNLSFFTNAIEATIIALVVLIPIAFYPRCVTVFLPAKEMLTELLILLALMFWGFKIVQRGELKIIHEPLNFPILSFISICILSLAWSNSPMVSLKELPLFLVGPLLYFIVTNNIRYEQQINRTLTIMITVGSLFGIYGILQYNGIDFTFWTGNIGRQNVFGLFGNVNFFAEYLIIPLAITISLFFASQNSIKKLLLLIGILAMGGGLILTFTRSSYLGFGVSLIFMTILFINLQGKSFIKENKKLFIIILAAIIIITLLFVIPNPLNKSGTVISTIKNRISISQLSQSFSIGSRISNWKFTTLMIKDNPLLGSGIGTYKYNSLRYQARFLEQGQNRSIYPYVFADKTHNEYLQLWAELGIVGLGIFTWFIISYFYYGLRFIKRVKNRYKQGIIIGLMGAVIAVLIDGIFGFPLHLPATIVLFWLSIGLTIVMGRNELSPDKENIVQKYNNKKGKENWDEKDNQTNKASKDEELETNKTKLFLFKAFLYLGIILLSVFLCVTVTRPFIARIHWFSGDVEMKKKNWNQAINFYERALKWDPYLGPMYYNIGKILQNKEFYNLSQEYLENAAKYVDHPDLPQDLSLVYLKKGLLDEAAIKLKQAISYQSNEKSKLPLYAELGNTYLQLKKYKSAEIVLKDALKIDPDFINAHYGLAGVYLNQSKTDEALVELQKVIELAPDSQEAKYAQNIIQQIAQEKLKSPPTKPDN